MLVVDVLGPMIVTMMVVVEPEIRYKPTTPQEALTSKRPIGEILWTMGPAKNRSTKASGPRTAP